MSAQFDGIIVCDYKECRAWHKARFKIHVNVDRGVDLIAVTLPNGWMEAYKLNSRGTVHRCPFHPLSRMEWSLIRVGSVMPAVDGGGDGSSNSEDSASDQ